MPLVESSISQRVTRTVTPRMTRHRLGSPAGTSHPSRHSSSLLAIQQLAGNRNGSRIVDAGHLNVVPRVIADVVGRATVHKSSPHVLLESGYDGVVLAGCVTNRVDARLVFAEIHDRGRGFVPGGLFSGRLPAFGFVQQLVLASSPVTGCSLRKSMR